MKLEAFFSISEQVELFLLAIALGAALGILFDCFRVIRIIFPPAKKAGAVCLLDIIFWLCYGFAIFVYSVVMGKGQVRVFYFTGSIIGLVLYIVTVGNLVTGVIRRVFTAIYRVLQKVYSIVIAPLVKITLFIRQKFLSVFVRSHKVVEKGKRSPFYHLKWNVLLLYNKKAKKRT